MGSDENGNMLFASTETRHDACRIPVTNSCNFLFFLQKT